MSAKINAVDNFVEFVDVTNEVIFSLLVMTNIFIITQLLGIVLAPSSA